MRLLLSGVTITEELMFELNDTHNEHNLSIAKRFSLSRSEGTWQGQSEHAGQAEQVRTGIV